MTVSSETNKVTYNGNGSTDTFAYTFRILDDDDILVQKRVTSTGVLTTLIKTTDYSVTGVGEDAGGNVVLVDPATDAPSGSTIVLTRNLSLLQETDYNEYDTFPAESHETALDRLTMIAQQQQEEIGRALKMDAGVSGFTSQILGTPSAGQFIQVNADGDGFEFVNASDIGTYTFPSGTGILVQTADGLAGFTRTITGTANEITVTNGDGVSGNPTISLPTALTFTGKTITGGTYNIPNTGLKVADTDASHYLNIVPGSNLTADHTLTLTTGDADRSVTLAGDLNVSGAATISGTSSGTNTGDQSLTSLGVTAAAQSILDDTTVDAIITTLGGAAYTGTGGLARATSPSLTTARFITSLNDTNGNELIKVTATASAVNEFTIANAATGNKPTFSVTGDDSNIGMNFQTKGTGVFGFLGTSSGPAQLDLYEDTDNGTNKVSIKAPSAVASDQTVTLKSASSGYPVLDADDSDSWNSWSPGFTGFSADPVVSAKTKLIGKTCFFKVEVTSNGTSNSTSFTLTGLPYTCASTISGFCHQAINAGSGVTTAGWSIAASGTTIQLKIGTSATGWTNSGNKSAVFSGFYETT